jgi:peroxiredoxin
MKRTVPWVVVGVLLSPAALGEVGKGQRAADFTLPALDGGKVALAPLRGKVVLLDFWASWCVPCRQELPELERLKGAYAAKGAVFLTINIDKERANAAQMAGRLKLTLPVGLDPEGKVAEKYELPTMPTAFIVDKGGVVRYVHAGFRGSEDVAKFKRELDELLAK